MADILYVDWDGLIYYDGKIKDYADDLVRECLKFKGDVSFAELMEISPSFENKNTAFKITNTFNTNEWFKLPGYRCDANTIVYVAEVEPNVFKYDILVEPVGEGEGVDLSNYYTIPEIDALIDELPTTADVNKIVNDAIENLDISITQEVTEEDLTNKFNEAIEYTDKKLSEVIDSIPNVDDFITEEDIPTDISYFRNDAGYLTEDSDALLNKSNVGHKHLIEDIIDYNAPDMSLYALKEEVSKDVSEINNYLADVTSDIEELKSKPSGVTSEELSAALSGYATKEALSNKANVSHQHTTKDIVGVNFDALATIDDVKDEIAKIEIPVVPTNISSFTNDAKYVTESILAEAISNIDIPETDSFATKSELQDLEDSIPSIEGLASESYVDNKISSLEIPSKVSQLTNDAGYITASDIPSTDLTNYYNKTETEDLVKSEIANIELPEIDTSNFYTKNEIDGKGYLTASDLTGYAKSEDIPTDYLKEDDLREYAKISDIPTDYLIDEDLAEYAKQSDIPNRVGALDNDVGYLTEVDPTKIKFTFDKPTTFAIGGIAVGTLINDWSLQDIIETALFGNAVPDVPVEPTGLLDTILTNDIPMYVVNELDELELVPYKEIQYKSNIASTTNDNQSTVFEIVDDNNNRVSGGYQHITNQKDTYYIVALPNELDLNEGGNVQIQSWSTLGDTAEWKNVARLPLTNDYQQIVDTYENDGYEVPVAPEGYTLWADLSDTDPGTSYRFIIKE